MALGEMALVKRNLCFDVLNVVLNVQVTPLSCKRSSSTCLAGRNYVLVIPTMRMSRYLAPKNASPTPPFEQTTKSTAPTFAIYLALVLL
jgi:hypothetical protein